MRKIPGREFTMTELRSFVICAGGILCGNEEAEVNSFMPSLYTGAPLLNFLAPMDALPANSIRLVHSLVHRILGARANAQIFSTVIKCVSILVIAFKWAKKIQAENLSVHCNSRSPLAFTELAPTGSIETVSIFAPNCAPIPLVEPFKISRVHYCSLTLGKWDQAVRLVKWLANRVPFHLVFHKSSMHELARIVQNFNTGGALSGG
jgi:hypothetical protein